MNLLNALILFSATFFAGSDALAYRNTPIPAEVWTIAGEFQLIGSNICRPVVSHGEHVIRNGKGCIAGDTDLAKLKLTSQSFFQELVEGFHDHGYGDLRDERLAAHLFYCHSLTINCAIEGIKRYPPVRD